MINQNKWSNCTEQYKRQHKIKEHSIDKITESKSKSNDPIPSQIVVRQYTSSELATMSPMYSEAVDRHIAQFPSVGDQRKSGPPVLSRIMALQLLKWEIFQMQHGASYS
jgi:hypothetical protein